MIAITTRRALLKAAPVIAASTMLAPPAIAQTNDTGTDMIGWERVKAELLRADAHHAATTAHYNEADEARAEWAQTAPERELAYTAEGFTTGAVSMAPYQSTFKLTRHNYQSDYVPTPVKATPEYAAFCSELEAWLASPEWAERVRAEEQAKQDDAAAWQAFKKAWHAVTQYPVGCPALIAEKLSIVTADAHDDGEWLQAIVTAVAADLARLNGGRV